MEVMRYNHGAHVYVSMPTCVTLHVCTQGRLEMTGIFSIVL